MTEIVKQREKGLLFNCDEIFVPKHHCKPRFQCLVLEETQLEDTQGNLMEASGAGSPSFGLYMIEDDDNYEGGGNVAVKSTFYQVEKWDNVWKVRCHGSSGHVLLSHMRINISTRYKS